jgi:hypothetical protein
MSGRPFFGIRGNIAGIRPINNLRANLGRLVWLDDAVDDGALRALTASNRAEPDRWQIVAVMIFPIGMFPCIDIQLGRLTLTPELPHSGRMNLGRRFKAGAAIRQTLRHVGAAWIQSSLRDATVLLMLTRRWNAGLNSRRRYAAWADQAIFVKLITWSSIGEFV